MLYAELLLIAILGSAFGSFFNVCIYRIPAKKSIVFPASYCPSCSTPIPWWLNVPLLGYLISFGKCRKCSSKIHWHYPLVEFITPVLFILLYLKFGFSIAFIKFVIFFAFGIMIFFIDAFHQIIPDVLSIPLIPLGLLFSYLIGGSNGLKNSIIAGLVGFVLFYSLSWGYWKLRGKMGLGGGDIKLIAGIGAFLGFAGLLFVILVGAILGLITILLIRYDLKKQFSFGPFLVVASMLFVLYGYQIIDLYLNLLF